MAVDRTEAEERQGNGIDGVDGEGNGAVMSFRFGKVHRFGVRLGFGKRVLEIAGYCEGEKEEKGEENGKGRYYSCHGEGRVWV